MFCLLFVLVTFFKNLDWNWDMSQGNWTEADFSGLKNLKEKFSSSNIKNCKFMNSDLSGLILGKTMLNHAVFQVQTSETAKFNLQTS